MKSSTNLFIVALAAVSMTAFAQSTAKPKVAQPRAAQPRAAQPRQAAGNVGSHQAAGGRESAARSSGSNFLRVKSLPALKDALVVTPYYEFRNIGDPAVKARGKRWARFEFVYETAPEWIDEVEISYYVMTHESGKGQGQGLHFFRTTVTYVDVAKGEHSACVFLPPNAVARYGEPVAFGADISVNGEPVKANTTVSAGGFNVKPGWWEEQFGDNVTTHTGYLKDRSQTPFAWSYIDNYEAVR